MRMMTAFAAKAQDAEAFLKRSTVMKVYDPAIVVSMGTTVSGGAADRTGFQFGTIGIHKADKNGF